MSRSRRPSEKDGQSFKYLYNNSAGGAQHGQSETEPSGVPEDALSAEITGVPDGVYGAGAGTGAETPSGAYGAASRLKDRGAYSAEKRRKKTNDIIISAAALFAALTLLLFTGIIRMPERRPGAAETEDIIPVSGSEDEAERLPEEYGGTFAVGDILGVGTAARGGAILALPREDSEAVYIAAPDQKLYIMGVEEGYYHVCLDGGGTQGYIAMDAVDAGGLGAAFTDSSPDASGEQAAVVEYEAESDRSEDSAPVETASDKPFTTAAGTTTTGTEPAVSFTTAAQTAAPSAERYGEMRAVWIAFFSETGITPEKIDVMVETCRDAGFNAIIFHVRPFGDAMYPSALFPWSHIACGTQGEAPANGFDPLAYIVRKAHENGMELHAWINPLRIQREGGTVPPYLSPDNPYVVWRGDGDSSNDGYVIDYKGGKYYNPAEQKVRDLIADGVAEIVRNYNVDGIHWDDYFYPASDGSFDDGAYYQEYLDGGGYKSLLDWRIDNINRLVKQCRAAVKENDQDCVFGISPAGNIKNCVNAGADVYEWCSHEGYIDYICPQIYWPFDSPSAPFDTLCQKWRSLVTAPGVKFYVGLALYKGGSQTADGGRWKKSSDIIARQIRYCRSDKIGADGYMVFSYDDLFSSAAAQEKANMIWENTH